jgi:hypothetical protein
LRLGTADEFGRKKATIGSLSLPRVFDDGAVNTFSITNTLAQTMLLSVAPLTVDPLTGTRSGICFPVLPFYAGERVEALKFHQKVAGDGSCEVGAVEISVPFAGLVEMAALRAIELDGVDAWAGGEADREQTLIGPEQSGAGREGSMLAFLVHV